MAQSNKMCFLATILLSCILSGIQASGQGKPVPLSQIVEKAEKLQPYHLRDYYYIEVSQDDGRITEKDEQCYQIWSAKADSVIPYYAGIAISSTGRTWKISPPAILRRSPFNEPRPKVLLKEAVMLAEEYVHSNGLLHGADHLHTAYLITMKNGSQYWHVLSDHVSLFVFMDGGVQETPEL